MEKTVNIGGRDMLLKATAKLPIVFEAQFGKNFMEVQQNIFNIVSTDADGNRQVDLSKLDYVGLCQIIWAMAKSGEAQTPPFDDWLDTLDALPMIDTIEEIIELLLANLVSRSRIKNAGAAAGSQRKV